MVTDCFQSTFKLTVSVSLSLDVSYKPISPKFLRDTHFHISLEKCFYIHKGVEKQTVQQNDISSGLETIYSKVYSKYRLDFCSEEGYKMELS